MTIGLKYIAGSIYQMLRGSLILFTSFFSVFFLNHKLSKHNFLGIICVVASLFLIGLALFLFPPDLGPECDKINDNSHNFFLGFILVLIAQIFVAAQYITEEKLMIKYECDPLSVVGWEGVWGCCMYFFVLLIFQFIKCTSPLLNEVNFATLLCSKNDIGEYRLEDTVYAVRQLLNNWKLMVYVILFMISTAVSSSLGVIITKLASSPARAVLSTIRTIVVWLFFLLPIVDKCKREVFNFMQLIGFVFLILGTCIFNEIIVVPCLEVHEDTNIEREKKLIKENEEKNLKNGDNLYSTPSGRIYNTEDILTDDSIGNTSDFNENDNKNIGGRRK